MLGSAASRQGCRGTPKPRVPVGCKVLTELIDCRDRCNHRSDRVYGVAVCEEYYRARNQRIYVALMGY